MKNKNLVLAVIAGLLIIVFGAGAYFLSQNKQAALSNNQTVSKPTETVKSAQSTLKELLASKNPQKCTYSTDAGKTKISGTVYVANGKVRGDFTTAAGKTMITGHMATDEKYLYTWTEGSKQGYKFATDTMTKSAVDQNSQKPDLNQKFNYSCNPWSLDNAMMELPKDVTFTAFTIPVVPSGTTSNGAVSNQTMCAACAGLTGDSKTACLAQLKCN